jgi:hypothetical protein
VFESGRPAGGERWVAAYGDEIARRGGAAGFLAEDAPVGWSCSGEDAYLLAELDRLA